MHYATTILGVLVLSLGLCCKSEATAEAEARASAEAQGHAAASIKPRIGGTVIATGDHAVEVLVHGDGLVEALVFDAKGELIAEPAKVQLLVAAKTKAGAQTNIAMNWNPAHARFMGRAEAGVELVGGPVQVSLNIDGKARIGGVPKVALAVQASHGGQVVLVGDYAVELVAQGGYVNAFVFDFDGKAHAAGDLDLKLSVGGKPLVLVWDAPSLSYRAKLDADLNLEAKPIELTVAAGGRAAVGAVASFHADAAAKLAADAKAKLGAAADLRAGADARLNLKAPEISVKAPDISGQVKAAERAAAEAKASVQMPSVNVQVNKSASASATGTAKAGAGAKTSGKTGVTLGTH
ncbi:MAG TPA: hypothetical protein VGJ84_16215 [Polyangiaceae bacterium]|jgi:hypothetical protein